MSTFFSTRVTEVVLNPDEDCKNVTISLQDTAYPQKKITFTTKDFGPKWHVGQVVTVDFHSKEDASAVLPEHEDGLYYLACYGKAVYVGLGKYDEFSADFHDEDQFSTFQVNSSNEAWVTSVIIDKDYVLDMVVIL